MLAKTFVLVSDDALFDAGLIDSDTSSSLTSKQAGYEILSEVCAVPKDQNILNEKQGSLVTALEDLSDSYYTLLAQSERDQLTSTASEDQVIKIESDSDSDLNFHQVTSPVEVSGSRPDIKSSRSNTCITPTKGFWCYCCPR